MRPGSFIIDGVRRECESSPVSKSLEKDFLVPHKSTVTIRAEREKFKKSKKQKKFGSESSSSV